MTEPLQLTDIGITPRKAAQFASKGIETVQDLLMFFPTKYLDFRNPINLAEGKNYAGKHVAVKGQVVGTRVINGKHFMLRLSDGKNYCSVFWFNQAYRQHQFYGGQVLAIGGIATWSDEYKSLTISAPDFASEDLTSAFCIKPIYRKIKGMSDEYLIDAINLALPYARKCIKDPLNEQQRNALRVPELARAVRMAHTCLIMVYKKFGITNDNNSIYDRETGQYKKMPLLQDLHKEMLKYPELHRISNILNPLITGSMACYNRPTNVDLKAKYIVFDFNGMKGAILTMSMFVVLDFVWTKIKEDRKKRKAVFIDECWKLIGTDSNEMAAEDVVEIFRTIRAYGGSAFAMTQDISQFYEYKGGKYGKAIIGNADTKIIMHLIPSEAQALQAAIQLTDAEMENVSSLQRGQGLVCSSSAKLFVDFVAADYEKQEITTDAKSFYMQEKALKEKQHQEEQARLEVEDKKEPAKTDDNSEKR